VLPEKEDILKMIRFMRQKNENKKFHERLLQVATALPTTADPHNEGDEDLRGCHSMTTEDILDIQGISPKKWKHECDQ
jgi:sulfur transfer protein SufE